MTRPNVFGIGRLLLCSVVLSTALVQSDVLADEPYWQLAMKDAELRDIVQEMSSVLGATIVLAPLAYWLWPAQTPTGSVWLHVIGLGIACTGVAYILFFRLIEQAGPARALAVTFVIPVFGVMYGVVLLGESVTPWMVLCGLVIVCGTALSAGLVTLPKRKG